ncbi:HD-GYP domain-containing protein [Sporomusa acidovorans]|uniref:HD-GYP domain-containing protein n=1 Tax=Sporomusa acidovorans TaxID=112900 RepID=UPI00088C7141|nr:HD-GYP domain-containing protein [Sporomusa acidovorans]OZC19070.1 cyclic di-GMP phosphodiesterase response regulator RpfG [Sporomusa acidovorans DSM 3132]SDD66304.1 HDIG domain-containing protein [Sporomusa acidovorans]
MPTLKFSLQTKLFASFFLLSAIITMAISYTLFLHMRTNHLDTLKRDLVVTANMAVMHVAGEAQLELTGQVPEEPADKRLRQLMQSIGKNSPDIARVFLLQRFADNEQLIIRSEWDARNDNGRQIGTIHNDQSVTFWDGNRPMVTDNSETGTVTVYAPVKVDSRTVAWLALEVDAAAVANDTRHFAERVFIVASGAVAVVGVCSWFLARNFAARIQRLDLAIDQIAAGKHDVHLRVEGSDEVSLLAARINSLATALHGERESLMMSTIESLVTALEAKDAYTYGHSSQVASIAEAIGRELGLAEDELLTLRIAALLHDIGKIGIPDHILNKPGRLDAEEWAIIKQHPETGAKIIAGIPALKEVAESVRHHHARWDGEGYPEALSRDNIPLGARIIAVADTYQAMISDRPYRTGMPEEVALEEIRRCIGDQFDPQVVDAFVKSAHGLN